MTGTAFPAACFCLAVGAVLGGVFLCFKLFRLLLRGGWFCTLILDVCFCLLWAAAAFLCALVMDKGRLRLLQAGLQALGTWGAVVALDPFLFRLALFFRCWGRRLRKGILWPICAVKKRVGHFAKKCRPWLRAKAPKIRTKCSNCQRKRKKNRRIRKKQKKHLKNLRKPVYNGSITRKCR